MSGATIGPVLPLISDAFSEVPNAALLTRLVLTMPALFIVIASPWCGLLVDVYGRKKLLVGATLLYAITGSAGAWLVSLTAILVSRALLGISVAAIMTVCITLIGDYFQGAERQHVMGRQSAFMAFGGVAFITAGGALADISWRAPFLIYTLALLLVPAVLIWITEPEAISKMNPAIGNSQQSGRISLKTVTLIIGIAFAGMAMFYMIPVQIPFLLAKFGDISGTGIGFALSSSVMMGAITALFYRRLLLLMSYPAVYLLCFFLLGTGYIMIFFAGSYPQVFVGLMIGGIGSGLLMPNTNVWLLSEAPAHMRGRFSGMVTTSVFLGQFLSPVLSQPLINVFSIQGGFLIVGTVVAISVMLIFSVRAFRIGRRQRDASHKGL